MIRQAIALFCLTLSPAVAGDWKTIEPGGETKCAMGTPYRFHMREGDPAKLMVFLNGGGACWSGDNCDVKTEPTTYRPFADGEGNDPRTRDGAFALDNPENPFKEWTQLFVPYCTGDIHLGTQDHTHTKADGSEITVYHRGRINAQAALDYLYEEVAAPKTVFLSGGSAGAVAAPYYAAELAQHYPNAQIIHFGGGGGGYKMPPQTKIWNDWGVFEKLPDWVDTEKFTAETTTFNDLYVMAADAFPHIKFHQYNNAFDGVQEQFSQMLGASSSLHQPLQDNLAEIKSAVPYFRSYTAPGDFHTLLRFKELYTTTSDGVRAVDWVRDVADGKDVADVTCGSAEACK